MRDVIWLTLLMLAVSGIAVLIVLDPADTRAPGWIQASAMHLR